MKKLFILLLILIPVSVWAWGSLSTQSNIAGSTVAEISCTSGTTDSSATTDSSSTGLYSNAWGQSFTVTENGNLYSISMKISGTDPASIVLRWGSDSTMATYEDEITLSSPGTGLIEFVSPTHPAVSTGTTYYWAVLESGSDNPYVRRESGLSDGRAREASSGWSTWTDRTAYTLVEDIKLCD